LRDPRPRTRVASACIDIRAYIRLRLRPPPRALALRRVRHPLLSATNLAARDSPLSPICRSLLDKGMIQQLNTKTTCRDPRILPPSLSLFVSLLFFFFFFFAPFFRFKARVARESNRRRRCIQLAYPCHCAPRLNFRYACISRACSRADIAIRGQDSRRATPSIDLDPCGRLLARNIALDSEKSIPPPLLSCSRGYFTRIVRKLRKHHGGI